MSVPRGVRRLGFLGVLLGISLALAAFGRWSVWLRLEHRLQTLPQARMLGELLQGERRRAYARAYLDPAAAEREMDAYCWEPRQAPTPFLGFAPAPGRWGNATINPQQFRHVGPVPVPKPAGTCRIFLTGGSTAFGGAAPAQERTIAGYLQTLLDADPPRPDTRYEVVNAANVAWSSTHERLWITNRLARLEPDLVISLSGNNEALWGLLGRDVLCFRAYPDEQAFRLLESVYAGVGAAPLPDVQPLHAERVPAEMLAERLSWNLRLARNALACPYLFALQPTLACTEKTLTPREADHRGDELLGPGSGDYFRAAYAAMRAALVTARAEGQPSVDLSGVFDATDPAAEVFLDSFHFGDRGNELLARALLAAIRPILAE